MCLGFDMKVVAIRRSIDSHTTEGEIELFPLEDLNDLLNSSDVVFVCLPETADTRELIGEEELDRLPAGAVLVNIARGEIVAEKALFDALSSEKLGAAGLDVWYQYPADEEGRVNTPPSAYPFHELDNVVMSPHRAGGWVDSDQARMEHLVQLLNKAAQGEPLQNLVDLKRGY
jgi:phosphoglycerate dehydrogenase-like enzyme